MMKFERKSGSREQAREFEQEILAIRRVTRVVKGGRRFSFSAAVAIGNKRGRLGVGLGKAGEVILAVEKAVRDAKKKAITLKLTESGSIPHQTKAKFGASRVLIKPSPGRGLVAGSAARPMLVLAGITDVVAKFLSRSKNKINNAKATFVALGDLPRNANPSN